MTPPFSIQLCGSLPKVNHYKLHTSRAHIFEVPALMNGTSSFLPLALDRCRRFGTTWGRCGIHWRWKYVYTVDGSQWKLLLKFRLDCKSVMGTRNEAWLKTPSFSLVMSSPMIFLETSMQFGDCPLQHLIARNIFQLLCETETNEDCQVGFPQDQ